MDAVVFEEFQFPMIHRSIRSWIRGCDAVCVAVWLGRSKDVLSITRSRTSSTGSGNALSCLTLLKKLCTHPNLVAEDIIRLGIDLEEKGKKGRKLKPRRSSESEESEDGSSSSSSSCHGVNGTSPSEASRERFAVRDDEMQGKFAVLRQLLQEIVQTRKRKVVVVSNYTETLDLVGGLCGRMGLKVLRLDGSVPAYRRQSLVDRFNNRGNRTHLVFLLSAKAGGVGLVIPGHQHHLLPSSC